MNNILETIGRTPLVKLERLFDNSSIDLYAKIEGLNPGGSIKDRTAKQILTQAIKEKKIRKGDTIVESSSGNMAIGLAQACLYYGLHLIVVVDPNVNQQNVKILEAYGARVCMVKEPALNGGYLTARILKVQEILERTPRSYWTNQYGNPQNPQAHLQTMQEIFEAIDGAIDYIFISTSTCGTLMGCAAFCQQYSPHTKLIAVDAVGSVIFGTPAKKRLIPGHGAGRPSQFLNAELVEDAIHVTDADCVSGCHELLRKEAIFCGGSSGAVVSAVKKYLPKIEAGATCAMIFCDRGERYLDTIYDSEWVQQHIYSAQPNIKIAS